MQVALHRLSALISCMRRVCTPVIPISNRERQTAPSKSSVMPFQLPWLCSRSQTIKVWLQVFQSHFNLWGGGSDKTTISFSEKEPGRRSSRCCSARARDLFFIAWMWHGLNIVFSSSPLHAHPYLHAIICLIRISAQRLHRNAPEDEPEQIMLQCTGWKL